MIIILDTTSGIAYNFTTRNAAAEFIGISRPTLRGWLKKPFFLSKSLIITHTSNEKVQSSKRALLKKKVAQFRKEEIERKEGLPDKVGFLSLNSSRPPEPAEVAAVFKPNY